MKKPARFISLEGSEGAGKTTAMHVILNTLEQWNVPCIQTREPGGEANAEAIRKLLLHSNHLESKTELMLMFAARNEHLVKVIRPALATGTWVISDRFVDASFAYQGFGRGIDWQTIEFFESWVVGETIPDLTLYLDVEPIAGLCRAAKRSTKDRIESEDLPFFENIRAGYLKRMADQPHRIKKINANLEIDAVSAQIQAILHEAKQGLMS